VCNLRCKSISTIYRSTIFSRFKSGSRHFKKSGGAGCIRPTRFFLIIVTTGLAKISLLQTSQKKVSNKGANTVETLLPIFHGYVSVDFLLYDKLATPIASWEYEKS
jgi:hypothetical protein